MSRIVSINHALLFIRSCISASVIKCSYNILLYMRSLKIFAKKYGIYGTGNQLLKNPLIILIQDINIGYRYRAFLLNTRRNIR